MNHTDLNEIQETTLTSSTPIQEYDNIIEQRVQPPVHSIKYRPDIDGLRALAVVPVVIFHAYPKTIQGGFTGVDIFFVISGYLISSILYKEHKKDNFTYADFYSRRIRRIFPALILVLTFTIVLGCKWLLAKPLKNMAATLVAGTLFGANLQLLTVEQGYFDDSVKKNPLLHLWSLGVEEQFYIFWPLFASIVVRLQFRKAVALQCLAMIASFVCNVSFLGYHGTDKYSFYFPLSRFWQMSVGGLLAYIHLPKFDAQPMTINLSARLSNALSTSGIISIVAGFVCIDESDSFPGYLSLSPTVGTAMVIFAGPTALINRYALGSWPAVFVGQISYALYLWHWPLLVYAKEHFPNEDIRPSYMQPYSMIILSMLLSMGTLYLIENNLRRHKSKLLVPLLFTIIVSIGIVGLCIYNFPESFSSIEQDLKSNEVIRYDIAPQNTPNKTILNWSMGPRESQPTVASIRRAIDDWQPWNDGYIFVDRSGAKAADDGIKVLNQNTSAPLLVVLGDSHANMLAPRFSKLYQIATNESKPFPQVMFRTRDGIPPLGCMDSHAENIDFILATVPKVVLVTSDWIQWLKAGGTKSNGDKPQCCQGPAYGPCSNQSPEDRRQLLSQFTSELNAIAQKGIKIFVTTSNPQGDEYSSLKLLNGNSVGVFSPISRSNFRQMNSDVISHIEAAIQSTNATLIDLSDNQCYEDLCQVVSMKEGEPVFKDNNHIRPYYAKNYLTVLDQVVIAALT